MKLDKPLTNCVNCGGVLKDGVCPFCDSDYRNINADFENGYVNVFHSLIDTDKLITIIKSEEDRSKRYMRGAHSLWYNMKSVLSNTKDKKVRK